ncbi:MAG: hypothetical protein WDZ41_00240 [Candidatus Babeliales bacterium]
MKKSQILLGIFLLNSVPCLFAIEKDKEIAIDGSPKKVLELINKG